MPSQEQTGQMQIRVRYAEVDAMGLLQHSRHWVYFEMGRTELLRDQGVAYRDIEASGVYLAVAKCSAKFHAAARYDDILTLTTRLVRIGPARIDHEYELRRTSDQTLLTEARTTPASVDEEGRIVPIPPRIRGQ